MQIIIFDFVLPACSRKDFGLIVGMEKDESYKVWNLVYLLCGFAAGYLTFFNVQCED